MKAKKLREILALARDNDDFIIDVHDCVLNENLYDIYIDEVEISEAYTEFRVCALPDVVLLDTDYAIIRLSDELLQRSVNNEIIIYGDINDALNDCITGSAVVPLNKLDGDNRKRVIDQIRQSKLKENKI